MTVIVVEGCAIATVDGAGTEIADGHLVIDDDRLTAVGSGPAPKADRARATRRVDGAGKLATPGLVNCHHHLFQWATRGYAQEDPAGSFVTPFPSGDTYKLLLIGDSMAEGLVGGLAEAMGAARGNPADLDGRPTPRP